MVRGGCCLFFGLVLFLAFFISIGAVYGQTVTEVASPGVQFAIGPETAFRDYDGNVIVFYKKSDSEIYARKSLNENLTAWSSEYKIAGNGGALFDDSNVYSGPYVIPGRDRSWFALVVTQDAGSARKVYITKVTPENFNSSSGYEGFENTTGRWDNVFSSANEYLIFADAQVDSENNPHVVFIHSSAGSWSSENDIEYKRFDGSSWSSGTIISDNPSYTQVSFVIDDNDDALVVRSLSRASTSVYFTWCDDVTAGNCESAGNWENSIGGGTTGWGTVESGTQSWDVLRTAVDRAGTYYVARDSSISSIRFHYYNAGSWNSFAPGSTRNRVYIGGMIDSDGVAAVSQIESAPFDIYYGRAIASYTEDGTLDYRARSQSVERWPLHNLSNRYVLFQDFNSAPYKLYAYTLPQTIQPSPIWWENVTIPVVEPEITSLVLNSTSGDNVTEDNLTAHVISTNAVTNIFNWQIDGEDFAVLNMPFDTSSFGAVSDYTSDSNDGTVNGASWTGSGRIGGAYEFNGNDFIQVSDSSSLDISDVTLEAWVYPNETDTMVILAKTNSDFVKDWNYGMYLDGTRQVYAGFGDGTNFKLAISSSSLALDTWQHVVAKISPPNIRIFVNGVEQSTSTSGTATFSVQNNDPLLIGADTTTGTAGWSGKIDNVRVYNRILSDAQISQLWYDSKDGFNDNSTVVSGETSIGDNWTVTVTPNDGTQDGDPQFSYIVIVPPAVCYCDSCSSCITQLNDVYCSTIMLNSSISDNPGTCITWPVDDKVLDCMSYTIDGTGASGSYGIWFEGVHNNTIRNCIVTDFGRGIEISSGTGNNVSDNVLEENIEFDVFVRDCNNVLEDNTGSGGRPIGFYDHSVVLQDETYSELIVCGGDESFLDNITIVGSDVLDNNALVMINTDFADLSSIYSSNNYIGVFLENSEYNDFDDVEFSNNKFYDVYSSGSDHNEFIDSVINDNSINFTYGGDIGVKDSDGWMLTDIFRYSNLSYYLDVDSFSPDAWMFLEMFYDETDWQSADIIDESTVHLRRYNGTGWDNGTIFDPSVDVMGNVVSGNLTDLGYVFAPFGKVPYPFVLIYDVDPASIKINETLDVSAEVVDEYGYVTSVWAVFEEFGSESVQMPLQIDDTYAGVFDPVVDGTLSVTIYAKNNFSKITPFDAGTVVVETPPTPPTPTECSNVSSLGIAIQPAIFSEDKVRSLLSFDYTCTKNILGLWDLEYYLEMKYINGSHVMIDDNPVRYGKFPTEGEDVNLVSRLGLLQRQIGGYDTVILYVGVWS